MSLNEILRSLQSILEAQLFTIGGTAVTASTVLIMCAIVTASVVVSKGVRRGLDRVAFFGRESTVGTVKTLVHYGILVIGFAIALQTAGIDLTALFAAGAIFAVGLGIAMQNIAESFVAGFILTAERTLKPGDILGVEGRMVRIEEMGIRSIRAVTQDGEEVIIPNSVLMKSTVKNYTLHNSKLRIRIPVGVVYDSDMKLVRSRLEAVAREVAIRWDVLHPAPLVAMTEFGDHAVKYEVAIWMSDPWRILGLTSEIHEAIWWSLKEAGVTIAFHQLDVHLDTEIADSFQRLAERVA